MLEMLDPNLGTLDPGNIIKTIAISDCAEGKRRLLHRELKVERK